MRQKEPPFTLFQFLDMNDPFLSSWSSHNCRGGGVTQCHAHPCEVTGEGSFCLCPWRQRGLLWGKLPPNTTQHLSLYFNVQQHKGSTDMMAQPGTQKNLSDKNGDTPQNWRECFLWLKYHVSAGVLGHIPSVWKNTALLVQLNGAI